MKKSKLLFIGFLPALATPVIALSCANPAKPEKPEKPAEPKKPENPETKTPQQEMPDKSKSDKTTPDTGGTKDDSNNKSQEKQEKNEEHKKNESSDVPSSFELLGYDKENIKLEDFNRQIFGQADVPKEYQTPPTFELLGFGSATIGEEEFSRQTNGLKIKDTDFKSYGGKFENDKLTIEFETNNDSYFNKIATITIVVNAFEKSSQKFTSQKLTLTNKRINSFNNKFTFDFSLNSEIKSDTHNIQSIRLVELIIDGQKVEL
ncbi:hypothetical protein [Mycoplasma sp. 3398]